jgi:hypothetical protein
MNNPLCAICGHVNRPGAVTCGACDARLDTEGWGVGDDPPGDAREPFASTGEPPWTASAPPGSGGARSPADDIPAPPFKSVGDVISPMLAVYRKHFTLVGLLVLVTTVPQALLQYGFLRFAGAGGVVEPGAALVGFAVTTGVLLWLLMLAGASLLSGALVYAIVDVQRAGGASAGDCLARGLKALPKVFLVSLLSTVVTIPAYLLLIVPGVILSLMLAVGVPAAIVEGRGPVDALKRSYELTKGYKGLIFITYFLWWILIAVLSWVVTWSFANNGNLDPLPAVLLQTTVQGMLTSTTYVLTVYIYLGLLREHRSGFQTRTFTQDAEAAAG